MRHYLLTCILLLGICAGCARTAKVKIPGPIEVKTQDRIEAVLKSDLPPASKEVIVKELLARESERGKNVVEGWKLLLILVGQIAIRAVP